MKRELAQTLVDAERSALIAQALRRVGSFERRTGIPVARVMTPPQGACSEAMMQTMARSGVEALCISNPRPWLASPPPEQPLIAWEPADFSTSDPAATEPARFDTAVFAPAAWEPAGLSATALDVVATDLASAVPGAAARGAAVPAEAPLDPADLDPANQ